GGATWSTPVTQGLTLQEGFQFAQDLAVDPRDGSHVVAATHNGIFQSTNGGDQWSPSTGISSVSVRDIKVSPSSPGELWLASWGSGAWRRTSPTTPWERIPLATLPREWLSTAYPDLTPMRVMVGAGDAWRSTNDGTTFELTNASSLNPFAFATDP